MSSLREVLTLLKPSSGRCAGHLLPSGEGRSCTLTLPVMTRPSPCGCDHFSSAFRSRCVCEASELWQIIKTEKQSGNWHSDVDDDRAVIAGFPESVEIGHGHGAD